MRTVDIDLNVKFMRDMMRSCYTYGGIERNGSNYNDWIAKYKDIIGEELFEKVYKEESESLSRFEVRPNVYTDNEGLTYNSLIPKTDDTQEKI